MNTIDELGDLTTFRKIIEDEITEFTDDTIIDLADFAFFYHLNLISVSFPNATSIGYKAFSYCSALPSVSFPNVISIGSQAFYMCTKLINVDIPNAITIERYAFRGCNALTSVSFPNVTSINEYSFNYCEKLSTVSFPKVTTIGKSAFYGCTKLATLYIGTETDTVCTLENTNAITSTVAYIYVPSALVEQYKTATNWSNFADKIKAYTGETA